MLTKISLCFLIFISPFMRNISFTMLIILCFVNVVNSKLLFTVSSLIFSQQLAQDSNVLLSDDNSVKS